MQMVPRQQLKNKLSQLDAPGKVLGHFDKWMTPKQADKFSVDSVILENRKTSKIL